LAAEIAVEEAKKANENLSNFSNDISRKKSEFQDGFQMPDNFDFPVEEFVKSNVFHAQNEAEKEHILVRITIKLATPLLSSLTFLCLINYRNPLHLQVTFLVKIQILSMTVLRMRNITPVQFWTKNVAERCKF